MLRLLVIFTIVAVIAFFGATVKLGRRTFFGHVSAIWSTDEAQDMRKGLEEKAGPALHRVKRGVEAGIRAATREDGGPVEGRDGGPLGDAAVDPEAPTPVEVEPPAEKGNDKMNEKPKASEKRRTQATP